MATGRKKTPDLFEDEGFDPVETAIGYPASSPAHKTALPVAAARRETSVSATAAKKKAGFYLSLEILNRFTHKFHELKLAGVAIDNKSTLLEAALVYALDDLDKGQKSQVLKKIGG